MSLEARAQNSPQFGASASPECIHSKGVRSPLFLDESDNASTLLARESSMEREYGKIRETSA